MKTDFSPEQLAELVPAARIAVDNDQSIWERIADFFERSEKQTKEVVEPRKLKD